MRLAPIDGVITRLLDFGQSYDNPLMSLGMLIGATGTMYDTTANVANWGFCELMSVSSIQAAAITPGTLCHIDKNFRIAPTAAAASELGLGQNVVVALTNFGIGNVTEQYGWALVSGVCPVQYSVAATVGKVYMGTAGKATPSQSAGIQLLNAVCTVAAVSTFTRTGKTLSGSSIVKFANTGGMYVGQTISGTGIPASSVISSLLPDGTSALIGSAIGTLVTATATGSVTVTLTNTNYGICQLSRPFVQGQIL